MALIKWSALVTKMAGEWSGTIVRNSKSGTQFYNKPFQPPPKNVFQQGIQVRYSQLVALWGTFFAGDKAPWEAATVSFPVENKVGDMVNLSGFALFMRINLNLGLIGLPPLLSPPTPVSIPMPIISSMSSNFFLGQISMNYDASYTPTNMYIVMYVSRLARNGTTFVDNSVVKFARYDVAPFTGAIDYSIGSWIDKTRSKYYIDQTMFGGLKYIDGNTGIDGVMATTYCLTF